MRLLEAVRALFEYNEWANNHMLAAADGLSEEELARKQGASFDSVQGNLAHIAAGQIVWLSRWQTGKNPKGLAEVQAIRGMGALRDAFAESHKGLREFLQSVDAEKLGEVFSYTDSRGKPQQLVRWKLMLHLANHGTHHRAETAMALAAMGKPVRELDYLFFELERA